MPSTLATYSPAPDILIAGAKVEGLDELLVAINVDESVTGLARCEVRLDNWGATPQGPNYLFADRRTFDFGATVDVAAGPPDERGAIFSGRITGVEADYAADSGPTVVIFAEDVLQDLRMTRRTRTFEDSSDADIARAIANDYGLAAEIDLDGPTHAVVCQLNQSDLSFLRDRTLMHAADVWLDGATLHVGRNDHDPLVLRHGRELLALRVLADLALQATAQRVAGWDADAKDAVLESADESSLGVDLGPDDGGGGILSAVFGERIATTTVPRAVSAAEATEIAKGLYRDRARRFVTGSGVTDGISALRAGRPVELQGLGAMFDGTYRLTRVVHRYDRVTGYRTDIDVERSGVTS